MTSHSGLVVRDLVLEAVNASQYDTEQRSHISMSAVGRCLRQQFYDITNVRDGITSNGFRSPVAVWEARDGYIHERDVIQYLNAAGIPVTHQQQELETYTSNGEKVKGHPDGVIQSNDIITVYRQAYGYGDNSLLKLPHDVSIVIDVKSMGYLRYRDAVVLGVKVAAPEYYIQLLQYMHELQAPLGAFFIKCKDSGAVRRLLKDPLLNEKLHVEFVEFNQSDYDKVIARRERLANALEVLSPPEREYDRNNKEDWQCRYCSHEVVCYGNG